MEVKIDIKVEAKSLPGLVKLAGDWILISNIRERYGNISKEELFLEIKKLHDGNRGKFLRIKDYYEGLWDEFGSDYIKEMGKIMDCDLNDNKMVYIVPSLWVNIADVIGRKNVFIVSEETQQCALDFILLHELTHLYYADVLEKFNLREAGESSLMEWVAHLILFKTPIKKLFCGIRYSEVSFVKKNLGFMKELEKLWENREDFKSFLEKAIELNKNTKGVLIC